MTLFENRPDLKVLFTPIANKDINSFLSHCRIYESGDFDSLKEFIRNYVILGGKAVFMTYLHQLYRLNPGDSRYRNKLKSRIQNIFPSELIFAKVKTNTAEVVLRKTVCDNTVHYSIDKDSSINEVASIIKLDIVSYCKTLPEMSWPPKIEEIERREMPESIRIFLTKLMSGKEHATVNNENVKRLVNSFGSD